MDNKFYIDDFEKFLKDKVDDFKMYPSQRVWHSIYNNMHPGSRWPSISMCITLICTLFLIGYLNTGTANRLGRQIAQAAKETSPAVIAVNTIADNKIQVSSSNNAANSKAMSLSGITPQQTALSKEIMNSDNLNNLELRRQRSELMLANASKNFINKPEEKEIASVVYMPGVRSNIKIAETATSASIENATALSLNNQAPAINLNNENTATIVLQKSIAQISPIAVVANNDKLAEIALVNTGTGVGNNITHPAAVSQLSETDKAWMENYAMYNRPAPKKWKGKLSMQVYFTPSVVYRNLENRAGKNASSLINTAVNNSDISSFVNHTPSFGLETGTSLVYDLFKKVQVKAGLQLNYTRYNVHAFNNYHPSLTSLTMNNESGLSYATYRSSDYSNFYGVDAVKLHSQTYQLSIPVGVNLKLASIDNRIDWYAGATVQPSFIFGGKSFLLSSDTRSYVPTTEFMNHFNVNTGLETFLSIKTKTGYTWDIGPQFRRQVFSTNGKVYSIQEKLVSYGIKLGISKKL